MRIMLLGAPGAGKGTQAQKLTQHFNIPQISTGDILRAAIKSGSELGKKVSHVMQAGQLVSDDLIMEIVIERLQQPDCNNGYLFDGFPRTLAQAKAMEQANINIDHVINIEVSDALILKRITGRRVHQTSGRTYHIHHNPPKVEGVDDKTGEPLIQRSDDLPETVEKRLSVYHQQTKPLIEHYQSVFQKNNTPSFHTVDGEGNVDDIFSRIVHSIQQAESKETSCP